MASWWRSPGLKSSKCAFAFRPVCLHLSHFPLRPANPCQTIQEKARAR